jgi:hypothetical protein
MPELPMNRRGRKLKNLFEKLMHANTDRVRLSLYRLPTIICHYYYYYFYYFVFCSLIIFVYFYVLVLTL